MMMGYTTNLLLTVPSVDDEFDISPLNDYVGSSGAPPFEPVFSKTHASKHPWATSTVWFTAMNDLSYNEADLLAAFAKCKFEFPDDVQLFIDSEHEEDKVIGNFVPHRYTVTRDRFELSYADHKPLSLEDSDSVVFLDYIKKDDYKVISCGKILIDTRAELSPANKVHPEGAAIQEIQLGNGWEYSVILDDNFFEGEGITPDYDTFVDGDGKIRDGVAWVKRRQSMFDSLKELSNDAPQLNILAAINTFHVLRNSEGEETIRCVSLPELYTPHTTRTIEEHGGVKNKGRGFSVSSELNKFTQDLDDLNGEMLASVKLPTFSVGLDKIESTPADAYQATIEAFKNIDIAESYPKEVLVYHEGSDQPTDETSNTDFFNYFDETIGYPELSMEKALECGVLYNYVSHEWLAPLIRTVVPFYGLVLERYEDWKTFDIDAKIIEQTTACSIKRYDRLGDDVLILAETQTRYWFLWRDCDTSDCSLGSFDKNNISKEQVVERLKKWVTSHEYVQRDEDCEAIVGNYRELDITGYICL